MARPPGKSPCSRHGLGDWKPPLLETWAWTTEKPPLLAARISPDPTTFLLFRPQQQNLRGQVPLLSNGARAASPILFVSSPRESRGRIAAGGMPAPPWTGHPARSLQLQNHGLNELYRAARPPTVVPTPRQPPGARTGHPGRDIPRSDRTRECRGGGDRGVTTPPDSLAEIPLPSADSPAEPCRVAKGRLPSGLEKMGCFSDFLQTLAVLLDGGLWVLKVAT